MKKIRLFSLVMAILLIFAACGSPAKDEVSNPPVDVVESNPPQEEIKDLVIAASDDWSSFDPFFQISTSNRIYNPMVFESLIQTGRGKFEPSLASSWEFNEDHTEIVLKLRENVTFHDGSEFNADDVVWNIERVKDVDAGYHLTEFFADCEGAEAIDSNTVKITWTKTSFVIEDALSRLYIVAPENHEQVATNPIGTGPFALKEWKPGDHATFVKYDGYWQEGKPSLNSVELRIIPDGQSRTVNLLSGDVHIIDNVSTQDFKLLNEKGSVTIQGNNPPEYKNFSLNIEREPFNNKKVRQAIAYCIDRQMVVDMVYDGNADARSLPLVQGSEYYPKDLEDYYTYDLEKAKELLKEAGYEDGFEFTLTVNTGIDGCLQQAEILAASLNQIGVTATLEPLESSSFFPRLTSNDFDMVSFGTGEPILDPSAYFTGAAVARTTRNFFGVTETTFPEYTKFIVDAASETNIETRKQYYHDALKIMLDESWTIPVTSTVINVAFSNNVNGLDVSNTAGEFHLENVTIGG